MERKKNSNLILYVIIFVLLFVICVLGFYLSRMYSVREMRRSSLENAAASEQELSAQNAGGEEPGDGAESVLPGGESVTEAATEQAGETVPEAETETETETETEVKKNGYKVCLDPGHQGKDIDMSEPEPIGPGAETTKAKATTGTTGAFTDVPEFRLALDIALLVRDELESRGYEVVLTREVNDIAISNSERAQLAMNEDCDIFVRIHANGSEDASISGALAMCTSPQNPFIPKMYDENVRLARDVLDSYCSATGFKNLGILEDDELTGNNWSRIPTALLEMGYMSNESDDRSMQDDEMRAKMAVGIANGIDRYFGIGVEDDGASGDPTEDAGPAGEAEDEIFAPREANGEKWSLSVLDLSSGAVYQHKARQNMQSASVIKCFIMGAVYDRICYPADEEKAISVSDDENAQLRGLLEQMISVSDNDAANRLVEILGRGDFEEGKKIVNDFCLEHGYTGTSLGRRFLEENPKGDNYTCAEDCRQILADIYNGTLVNEEASGKMLDILKMQTNRTKIPSGLPEGTSTANKTGEMPEGYGLGCIENDMAIVFSDRGDYVIAVLSNELAGRNDEAVQTIRRTSSLVWDWLAENAPNESAEAGTEAEGIYEEAPAEEYEEEYEENAAA